MAQRNLYLVLGVPQGASTEAIRAAFRERAKLYHPDHAGPRGADFQQLAEAYGVLSDPRRRGAYDRASAGREEDVAGAREARPGWRPEPTFVEPVSVGRALRLAPETLADEIDDFTARYASGIGVGKSGRRRPLVVEVVLTPWEAARGGELPIRLPTVLRCDVCRGMGEVWLFPCSACGGGGAVRGAAVLHVRVPPGLEQACTYDLAVDPWGLDVRVVLRVAAHV